MSENRTAISQLPTSPDFSRLPGTELEADWRERLAAAGRGQEQGIALLHYGGTPFGGEKFVSEMKQRSGKR